jgi:hypothetical protein
MNPFVTINYLPTLLLLPLFDLSQINSPSKIFDVHLHVQKEMGKQFADFKKYNIVRGAFR